MIFFSAACLDLPFFLSMVVGNVFLVPPVMVTI